MRALGRTARRSTEQTVERTRGMMNHLSRRGLLGGTTAAAVALFASSVHAQKGRRTLRFVPHADLKILDPVWTTGYITRNHGYMIYDMLFAPDASIHMQPQMVDKFTASPDKRKWSFTLRDGLKWHDGQPVTAEDCVLSIKRFAARDSMGQKLMDFTESLEATDARTITLKLREPYAFVLESIGKPSSLVPFMM